MKKFIANNPYEKLGRKPEFIKEIESKDIRGFNALRHFINSYKDKLPSDKKKT